ncbi:Nif3-like dinuclear metal center hexameric protein [Niastella yeongjuensis]|uniref:GTP cyclohydrolase 1 type 2 homolog n=1 Tax=Niastella yeongjuensis TaxID=354355 RepID=A0A1V9EM97_9BACT|nr:Nif3-like dinuclear metal center hexameric protein [Niastella yeongjuensis]OQP47259.1 Nif3-like dinuclear metal center hexameric protein [Niastella yeongjuensis]SEN76012.1 dinuclear metal center protein, YbgI/SA1388 family [Niastella yeongjuensis]
MKIADIIALLEAVAPPSLQESYDNAGLLTGNPGWVCTGALCTLDATEEVVNEAIQRGCNLVVAHHPIIFGGLKKITGRNYVEKTIITAIKNDIAIYAIHTNLDNVIDGVNGMMADKLGLKNRKILSPKEGTLKKLYTFVPVEQVEQVRAALFEAGGGHIGNYNECSFGAEGTGTFKGGEGTNPFVGQPGERHYEKELKMEVIFPAYLQNNLIRALRTAHPYEEVAYDVVNLANTHPEIGSGLVGELPEAMPEAAFLKQLKQAFDLPLIRHTALSGKPVKKIALCGGAGSFLVSKALGVGADVYITGDMKYHEFFDANGRLIIADIGHFESEQFTIDLLAGVLQEKFPTFAVLKTALKTNPVHYFV